MKVFNSSDIHHFAFNIVFKCVQIFIYLNIAILFNLQCTTQLSLWHPPLPNGNSVLHNWMFPTDCSTTVAQIPKFIQNMRTINSQKNVESGIGSCKTETSVQSVKTYRTIWTFWKVLKSGRILQHASKKS